jgi:hypothetical protein
MERPAPTDIAAGVIHQNIDHLPVFWQPLRQASGRYGIGHIQLYGQGRSRQFIKRYLQALKTAGATDYSRSSTTQHANGCEANASTGPRHKGRFPLECCHWYLLIWAVVWIDDESIMSRRLSLNAIFITLCPKRPCIS